MRNESAHVSLEWVVIPKRRIYAAALVLVTLSAVGAGLYLWLNGTLATPSPREKPAADGARFQILEGDVRVVRNGTREIVRADADTRLRPGDVVQTQATGRASLKMADGSTLSVRPNSVLTIAENDAAGEGQRAHVRVAVEGGGVRVQTEGQTPETSHVVETPLARNRLSSRTEASFDVHEDRSEEIRVSEGSVETSSSGGKTNVRGGEYVALGASGDIRQRERLLNAPMLYAPADLEKIPAQADSARVTLQWTRPMAAANATYRVVIASSPFFVKPGIVFERDRLVTPKLIVTELRPGNYFWRVQALSTTGQASEWSGPQKFTVVRAERK